MEFIDGKPVHSRAYRWRRFLNWFPLGLTYAFLYMGRYNLTVSKNALGELMTKADFGAIFGAGTLTYAFAFLSTAPSPTASAANAPCSSARPERP